MIRDMANFKDSIEKHRIGRLTIQIGVATAAFLLAIEAILFVLAVDVRRADLERMREKMYGQSIRRTIVKPEDLLSDEYLRVEIRRYQFRLALSTLALLGVVVGGTILIVHHRAVRPIRKILDYDNDSLHGKIRFIPEKEYPANELGMLMHSRNLMLYSLLQAYKKEAIDSLVTAVDAKDRYTYGHSRRVGFYAASLARSLGLPKEEQETIRQAGYLHDIGKIAIPEALLNANRALTPDEWEVMKKHPSRGEAMLRFTTFPEEVRMGALTHHENHDGSGYPDQLKGDQIPIVGRILHVADALDAMTSERPYRKSMSMDRVVDEFMRNRGKMFDPRVVTALMQLIERGTIKIRAGDALDSSPDPA